MNSSDSLGDILASLTDEDINNLRETAASLFGGKEESKNEIPPETVFDFSSIDPSVFLKISHIMSSINSVSSDPRCDLLRALKPLLSDSRKKRADEAVQMMKMLQIIPLIQGMK